DTATLVDRAFRWATRLVERREPIAIVSSRRARPVSPRDGLIIREVRGRESAALFLELSERLYHAFTSEPAAFVFGLVATLELFGIHVRIRIYRDPPADGAEREPVGEHDLPQRY